MSCVQSGGTGIPVPTWAESCPTIDKLGPEKLILVFNSVFCKYSLMILLRFVCASLACTELQPYKPLLNAHPRRDPTVEASVPHQAHGGCPHFEFLLLEQHSSQQQACAHKENKTDVNPVSCRQWSEWQSIPDQMLTAPCAVALTPPTCWKCLVRDIPGSHLPCSQTHDATVISWTTNMPPLVVSRSKMLACYHWEDFLLSARSYILSYWISCYFCYANSSSSGSEMFSPHKTSQGNISSAFQFTFAHSY